MSLSGKKKWRPSFPQYAGQKVPAMTERDVKKMAYLERRRREKEYYRLAKETLRDIQKINEELKAEGLQDIQKSSVNAFHEHNVNDLVRKILRGKCYGYS